MRKKGTRPDLPVIEARATIVVYSARLEELLDELTTKSSTAPAVREQLSHLDCQLAEWRRAVVFLTKINEALDVVSHYVRPSNKLTKTETHDLQRAINLAKRLLARSAKVLCVDR
jgi:hypothetical protein